MVRKESCGLRSIHLQRRSRDLGCSGVEIFSDFYLKRNFPVNSLLNSSTQRLLDVDLSPSLSKMSPPVPHPSTSDAEALGTLDDVTLMHMASSGDSNALAEIYDRHAPLIHSVLTQKLGDPAESQDIVHDIFVKLHTKCALYNPALGKPIAWLLTVARNAAIDKLRKRSLHQNYVNRQMQETEEITFVSPAVHQDEVSLLHHCIGILPNQQRDMLQLAYFSGLTQHEISESMSQPLGSVKAWIRRGLINLKDCVEGKL